MVARQSEAPNRTRRRYESPHYTAGAEEALERASAKEWTIVSTENDWRTLFSDG